MACAVGRRWSLLTKPLHAHALCCLSAAEDPHLQCPVISPELCQLCLCAAHIEVCQAVCCTCLSVQDDDVVEVVWVGPPIDGLQVVGCHGVHLTLAGHVWVAGCDTQHREGQGSRKCEEAGTSPDTRSQAAAGALRVSSVLHKRGPNLEGLEAPQNEAFSLAGSHVIWESACLISPAHLQRRVSCPCLPT